jgi:exodeoxyribonuclease V alpha subunit
MTEKSGIISKIIYKNESNGYTVCAFETDGDEETIVGYFGSIDEGTSISVCGDYINHAKYGRQFKVESYKYTKPKNLDEIQLFFIFNKFDGIGPVLTNRIIDRFGTETIDIIENEPERLLEVKGISKQIIDSVTSILSKRTAEQEMEEEQVKQLLQYDISLSNATKIYRTYKDRASFMILNEPYKMTLDIEGFVFKTFDDIAMKTGFLQNDERRILAAIEYIIMQYQNATGNCYINKDQIPGYIIELLQVNDVSNFDEMLEKLQLDRKIVVVDEKIYLRSTYIAEKDSSIILNSIKENVKIITGGPGTGKTTKVKHIADACIREGGEVKLCAPTGRAAKRIKEQTGFVAQTIHRLLGYSKDEQTGRFSFAYNSENKLDCDLVIVDEASMLDLFLLHALLKAIPEDTKLLFVGDVDQLPSVGCGQVLKDMINSKLFDTEYLNKVHRQESGSKIIENAHKIRNKEFVNLDEKSDDFIFDEAESGEAVLSKIKTYICEYLPARFKDVSSSDIQIICPSKIGP